MNQNESEKILRANVKNLSEPLKSAVEFMLTNFFTPSTSELAKNFLTNLPSMLTEDAELKAKIDAAYFAIMNDKDIWYGLKDLPHEIWRDVIGYTGFYQVSNYGRVKSFCRGKEKIIKPGIYNGYLCVNYLDDDGNLTEKFYSGKVNLGAELQNICADVVKMLGGGYEIENARDIDVEATANDKKLSDKNFLELWAKISQKSFYSVEFDSNELIKGAIDALNQKLSAPKSYFIIERGTLNYDLKFDKENIRTEEFKSIVEAPEIDLIAELAKETDLTRRDIAEILKSIELGKVNHEKFIPNTKKIILAAKAAQITANISYTALDERFNIKIFSAPLKGRLNVNATPTAKNIYDYLIFDSDIEKKSESQKMCDEVFGEKNFVADILWNSTKSVTNTAIISVSHTHNLVYFKNMDYFIKNRTKFRLPDDGEGFSNPDNDPRGAWKADPFQVGGWRPNQQYEIINPNTGKVYKPNPGCSWKNDYEHFKKLLADNRIVFGKTGDGAPLRKRFIHEAAERGKVAKTWWDDVETTTNGTQSLKKMFDGKIIFDNPKPVSLIKKFLQLATEENAIVMDFFSGSATTAHAVMELNAQDGGNRRFIMIQIDEPTPENSEARRAGFKTICDIGKERIRRAGDKIKAENPAVDTGFRVFKVDSSNFKPIPKVWTPQAIELFAENIKDDRDEWDLLLGTLLEIGKPIDLAVEVEEIGGVKVLKCAGGEILASFDKNIPAEVFRALARRKPQKIFFRDASFASSVDKINALEFFRNFAPDTTVKVL